MPTDEHKERRHVSLRDVVSTVVLVLNFAGLVWGAATLSSSVTQLGISVSEVKSVATGLVSQMSNVREDYGARIRLLEAQVADLRRKDDLK